MHRILTMTQCFSYGHRLRKNNLLFEMSIEKHIYKSGIKIDGLDCKLHIGFESIDPKPPTKY